MTILDQVRSVLLVEHKLDLTRPLVVGVSGGPDSLCLLDCLHRLGFHLVVAHFNHNLRPDSGSDALAVRQMAADRGLPFIGGEGDVAAFSEQNRMSIEEAARTLRYHFLFSAARQEEAQAVAVGHTADDQVETVLMHFLRGAGLAGLKGMQTLSVVEAWDAQIPLTRPLLGVWRAEVEAYCREYDLAPLIDLTNQQVTYFRNRLRHELVPELQRYNPQAKETILRTAQVLAGDWEVIERAVEQAWREVFHRAAPGICVVSREKLLQLPVGLQRAVFRRMISMLRPGLRDIDFETVERCVTFLARPSRSRSLELPQGLNLTWEAYSLVLAEKGAGLIDEDWPSIDAQAEMLLPVPGELDLGGGWTLLAELGAAPVDFQAASAWEAWLNEASLALPLVVRAARRGERFQPLGMQGRSQKLSDFWINARVPRRLRGCWPLVCSAAHIVWIPGQRIAEIVRVDQAGDRVAHLRLFRRSG